MSKRKKPLQKPAQQKAVSYAFVGLWNDGRLGWKTPEYLCQNGRRYPDRSHEHAALAEKYPDVYADDTTVLVKITMEVVNDKQRKPILRRPK